MRVTNNIHNIACLDEAELIQEWTEEEKIPVKTQNVPTVPTPPPATEEKKEGGMPATEGEEAKPAEPQAPQPEPEQQYEIKKKSKKNFVQLKFSTANFSLPPDQKTMFRNLEDQLLQGDKDILEMKELRNTLEAYSYEMRNNLDSYGTWEKYLDEETRKSFLAEINQVVDWIYGDGESAPKKEYQDRIDKFRTIGEPVKARHFYYSELDVYKSQSMAVIETINQKLGVIDHLTDLQKEEINKKLAEFQKFCEGVQADREAKQLHENPAYNLDQIISMIDKTKRDTEAIFNLPPPKPETKKAEDSTADSGEKKQEASPTNEAKAQEPAGDAEMQNEEKPATAE